VHTTPDRTAAALWIPAGPEPEAPPEGYAKRLAEITGRHQGRFLILDDEFDRHHLAGTPHHYLAILAVRPDRQAHGMGTALLAAHHATPDTEGIPAYLEAADQRSRRLYLTCGYIDYGEPIRLPEGPVMHPMVRKPQPHQPAG
jgi:GNAT superfamily N-acetyltransferase